MNRKELVNLFQKGMQYPPGRHRFWISRCFEITVRPDSVVELDEYEDFASERRKKQSRKPSGATTTKGMFHVGRSVLDLRDGQVKEEPGKGWERSL